MGMGTCGYGCGWTLAYPYPYPYPPCVPMNMLYTFTIHFVHLLPYYLVHYYYTFFCTSYWVVSTVECQYLLGRNLHNLSVSCVLKDFVAFTYVVCNWLIDNNLTLSHVFTILPIPLKYKHVCCVASTLLLSSYGPIKTELYQQRLVLSGHVKDHSFMTWWRGNHN